MENNIFSPKRFGNYFRLQLATNWKTYLTMCLCLLGCLLLYCIIFPYIFDTYWVPDKHAISSRNQHLDYFWNMQLDFYYFVFYWFAIISASKMFSGINTKTQRVSVLTIPASNYEKYLTNFVIYIIAPYFVFFISMLISDYARVLSTQLYTHSDVYIARMPLTYIFSMGKEGFEFDGVKELICIYQIMYFGSIILLQSYFTLISSIWPKNSLLKGFGVGLIMTIISITCIALSIKIFGTYIPDKHYVKIKLFDTPQNVSNLLWMLTTILSFGFYCLSYIRFKENEVINRW